jgi:hypothetical protein
MHPATHSIPWIEKNGPPGTAGSAILHHCRSAETKEPSTRKRGLSENRIPQSIDWFINVNHHCPNIKIAIWGYTPFLDNRDMK